MTEFGADYLRLVSINSRPTITSVELEGVKGNIALTHVYMVPFGGVGNAWPWSNPIWYKAVPTWSERKSLPAELVYPKAPASGITSEEKTLVGEWQVVIGLQVKGRGGTATGLRINYTDAGKEFTINGGEGFSVVQSEANLLK